MISEKQINKTSVECYKWLRALGIVDAKDKEFVINQFNNAVKQAIQENNQAIVKMIRDLKSSYESIRDGKVSKETKIEMKSAAVVCRELANRIEN